MSSAAVPDQHLGIGRRALAAGLAGLVLLVLASAWTKVAIARADPAFDPAHAEGLLKSDPALAAYLVQRVVESGGGMPDDFAADPRIQFPDALDVRAHFPLAQVFFAAWWHRATGGGSLVASALVSSAVLASLVLVGVYLAALELTRRVSLALLAALLAALMVANHRTIGFVFVDEDACVPFLALHVALVLRALRVRTSASIVLAALSLGGALATWHAAGFFASLEALVALGWLAVRRTSPLSGRRSWLFPAVLFAFAIAVPFLRHAHAALSFPIAASIALCIAGEPRIARGRPRVAAAVALALLLALGAWLASNDAGDSEYTHVFALLAAKIEHLGWKPADARGLSADVRLMWQGPFETLDLVQGAIRLGVGGLLAFAASVHFVVRRRETESRLLALVALFAVGLAAAWLVERTLVLAAFLAPVLAAAWLSRARAGATLLAVACAVQIALFTAWASGFVNQWYQPPERQQEIEGLVRAVREHVPASDAVAADFMSSTAILAWTRRPIVFQPKWEWPESRRRARELLEVFHQRSPAELRQLLVERYDCRWLVVDRYTLGVLAAWSAGLRPGEQPRAGSAAAVLLSSDDATLRSIEGYELVWRSSPSIRSPSGRPTDFFRLYRLKP